jgi:hypothetical protein
MSLQNLHPTAADAPRQPWWRYKMMWLVVGGPLIVVVAAIVTAVIATRGADPVLDTRATRAEEVPAIQGRNHAATPTVKP